MDQKDLYTIAIGASAGGMEAIHLLFDNTPEDGAAYVIIQHLSPDHKSFMAELLAKHSKLKIFEAENNMLIESNCVYLMPKGKNMTIKDRRLHLTDSHSNQPNKAIDIFLNSLAEDQGDKSIAVILSGTGTDGTKGIAAIKKFGGQVIVQDPESAKYNGMPNSAIQSGNVDAILIPELIPDEIIAYLKQDTLQNSFSTKISENDEKALLEILNLIEQHTPLDFTNYKRPTIIRRIVIRMTHNNLGTLEEYTDFLKKNPSEISVLTQQFLISVTKFFRDQDAFSIISEKVIPEIIESKLLVDKLKIWVVGCATGEEAYSLAILIQEYLTSMKKNLEVKIFASDIDKTALLFASKGVYGESIATDVSAERLDKFFIKQDKSYKVRDNIRKMIIFADHDIVKQPPYGKIDLISCRNLLIYINPLLQKRILASLHFCLNLGGYLFLGPSESIGELKQSFEEIDKKWKIYKNTQVALNFRNTTYSTPGLNSQWDRPSQISTPISTSLDNSLSGILTQTLLEESGYEAGVCVDGDFKIIQFFGNYEKYLLPKIFNFSLLEMLPEDLYIATSTTLRKAVKENKKEVIKGVKFSLNELICSVNIYVKPIPFEKPLIQQVILVLFSEEKERTMPDNDAEVFQMEKHSLRYLEDLNTELAETKHKLKEALNALKVSNENIDSYNEELISSNEEMQSTNEELQSVNEELQTVNNEYQLKIKELADLNDDLNNYFKGTLNGQIYVDKNLIVRKFTPSAVLQVNLKESDIGRPLGDISTNIKFSILTEDIKRVISVSNHSEKEIQTKDNKWYQMMIIPFIRQQNNEKDGAIITFNDITELKQIQEKLAKINADHGTFIYSASHDLKGPLANVSALISFLKDISDPDNRSIKDLTDLIEISIAKLKETINELSDIAKTENEINEVESVSLPDLLEEVQYSIRNKILESKVLFKVDFKVPEIPFSKKNLRSILLNILDNAIKYRSPERDLEVVLRTEETKEYVVLSVRDNGLGLESSKRNEIFLKFKRQHSHVEGSGVGLYLVKKLMTNAGGKIEVESELGKGSVFRLYFKK
ncbi:chemotaxis protein CheB [Lunatibacter salilacus]|uniref:chemotaxis protein CheB n=1 Tax=Lunatibacter salilacus TaxID=2483804 RepID=UPI00131B0165|nr:chemotaxis protein CheB [Lunatibacter salilacus]